MAVLQYVMYSKKSWSRSSGFDFFPSLSAGLMKAFHFVHIVLFLSFFSGQISRNRKKELWQLFLWPLWAIYVHIGPFLSALDYFCPLRAIFVLFGWPTESSLIMENQNYVRQLFLMWHFPTLCSLFQISLLRSTEEVNSTINYIVSYFPNYTFSNID